MLSPLSGKSAFLLIDAKNFYASVEELFDPQLHDHPVGVLSANDGCFISRNDQLKALGVPMAGLYFENQRLLEKCDARVFSANFELYLDMSQRFYGTVLDFSPDVERYSVDEVFMEMGESKKSFSYIGHEVLEKVYKWTGLISRVGIGSNKTLSKIANNLAKKSKKANGVVDLYSHPEHIDVALERTKIDDVWGIGEAYAEDLIKLKVNNAKDFKYYNHKEIRQLMTVKGARTHLEINGVRCFGLEMTKPMRKAIGVQRSFGEPVSSFSDVHHAVSSFLMLAVNKLQNENLKTKRITVYVSSSPFADNFYGRSESVKLSSATDNIFELQRIATSCLKKIFQKGVDYRRAGVTLDNLIPKEKVTEQFMEFRIDPKKELLNRILFEINKKFGQGTLKLASVKNGQWRQKKNFLSLRPTTRFEEVIRLM